MDVLLPVCISIAVLGVVAAVVLWSRRRRGRALQAVAVGTLPFGLYLTGLLPLVWSGAIELIRWAGRVVFSPPVWAGIALLVVTVILWLVGGLVARRTQNRPAKSPTAPRRGDRPDRSLTADTKTTDAKATATQGTTAGGAHDSDFDEIEALLRKRGIE